MSPSFSFELMVFLTFHAPFVMLVPAAFYALVVLVIPNHALIGLALPTEQWQTQKISRIPSATSSRTQAPLITGFPLRLNRSATIAEGMVNYDNATFATSCGYNDSECASRCSWHHEVCARTWADWYRTGLEKSMNSDIFTTVTESFHEITQSLKVIDDYTYAMGPEITTKSGTTTYSFWDPQLEIVSTLVPRPSCKTPTFSCTRQPWCNTDACTVQGGTVELLFWPATSTTLNSNKNATVSDIRRPVTAVYKNFTLTSPSVYLEYKTAYALNGCAQTVGGSYSGAILALDPDDLFSIDARNDYYIATTTINNQLRTTSFYQSSKLDYDHLTGLPPGAAYQGMPMCVASGCGIITPSLFHPQLILPTHIRKMDPAWATCGLDWHGSWDPPIALTEAETIAMPTHPADPTKIAPASSRPILDGPAKMTALPDDPTQPPSTTSLAGSTSSDQQPSGVRSVEPSFAYSPISPSSGIYYQPLSGVSDITSTASITSSVVQVTTIVQVSQGQMLGTTVGSVSEGDPERDSTNSAVDGTAAYTMSNTNNPEKPSQQSSDQTINGLPNVSSEGLTATESLDQPRQTTTVAGQIITARPDGGLELSGTLISPGGSPITISSAIYSAASGGALVIISESPAVSSSQSPTNALEVLSEALGTATADLTYSFAETFSKATSLSFSPNDAGSAAIPTDASDSEAILDLGSTTITATQHPSNILQIGSQLLNSANPIITINGHTLSTASNATFVDGTTAATFTQQPDNTAQPPTILITLGTSLLTAQAAAASSGAVEIGSLTLVPGSSALVTNGHTLSAAASGLVLDGSLVVPRVNTSVSTSLQSLPSVQVGGGSGLLPSVTGGSAIDSEGGEVVSSGGEAAGGGVVSSAGHLRQVGSFSWFTCVVMLVASAW
jgi:hypothetical protein